VSASTPARSPRETAELMLRTVAEGTRDELADLYAPDVQIVNVWAPGGPAVSEGREHLRARMNATAKLWDFESTADVSLHETADPEVVVLEYRVNGRLAADDTRFSLGFVSVLRIVDGLIVHARDYSNPEETAALLPYFEAAGGTLD
jgi:ketosteroid isomerase-like protein